MPEEKTSIGLWKNESQNAKAPQMTGQLTCPCCDKELRVAVWTQEVQEGKPLLSGQVEPKVKPESSSSSGVGSLDDVMNAVTPDAITPENIPF